MQLLHLRGRKAALHIAMHSMHLWSQHHDRSILFKAQMAAPAKSACDTAQCVKHSCDKRVLLLFALADSYLPVWRSHAACPLFPCSPGLSIPCSVRTPSPETCLMVRSCHTFSCPCSSRQCPTCSMPAPLPQKHDAPCPRLPHRLYSHLNQEATRRLDGAVTVDGNTQSQR